MSQLSAVQNDAIAQSQAASHNYQQASAAAMTVSANGDAVSSTAQLASIYASQAAQASRDYQFTKADSLNAKAASYVANANAALSNANQASQAGSQFTNAAGAAENVPVLEIVETPNMAYQNDHAVVHHTFGDGNYTRFIKAHEKLGIKSVNLTAEHPVDDINDAIAYMVKYRKPVYLTMLINIGKMSLNQSLQAEIPAVIAKNDAQPSQSLLNDLQTELNKAKKPLVVVGHEVINARLSQFVADFVKKNHINFTDIGLGKDAVDESLPEFIGTYDGKI
ncbi:hypothetical protein [Nicoliella lavandulae]|uniref:Thiamine pyrophosphate enzyme central domain-containing protein n=1 Tax=Nicoliella lavandulae TaxID=3082954 RepID=A0ABU8SLV9_9LACO